MRHDVCGVCRERMKQGCLARELVGTGPDDGLYGHAKCVDGVVKRLIAKGDTYLGNIDLDR